MQKLAILFHAWAEKANSKNEEEKTHVHVSAPPNSILSWNRPHSIIGKLWKLGENRKEVLPRREGWKLSARARYAYLVFQEPKRKFV